MKTVMIGIARMGSTRLPGKVLKDLNGTPVLDHIANVAWRTPGVDQFWIATSTLPQDDVIEEWCGEHINCFRGSETDVLSRFYGAAYQAKADVVVRITCDCPFLDPQVIGEVIALRKATGAAYASNNDPPTWPDGLDCEAMTFEALYIANKEATRPTDRDTVTQYIVRNRSRFPAVSLPCPIPGLHRERWVLDTEADYEFCKRIAEKCRGTPSYLHILKYLNENPELRAINSHHPRNERFFEALAQEEPVERPHTVSKRLLAATRKIIPLGTQTFSKSYLQYPEEAPLFVTHGNGGIVYDVDGNDYVDLVGGLLPNILGHRDPDVDFAIRKQLGAGISFSLATDLEGKLADELFRLIPCAEMSRFGKNGTDVTTAAIRLARHITRRDKILSSGFHGWADWSICHDQVRKKGVMYDVGNHTAILDYNGDERCDVVTNLLGSRRFACVIVEPETDPGFLKFLREQCDQTGTLLIFDEIITGFRFGLGGAQALYHVTPDLATFGKSMANGMPISVLCGKREYMEKMEEICFSGTFFGETLSLAAALATLDKLELEDVPRQLQLKNFRVIQCLRTMLARHDLTCIEYHGDRLLRLNFKATRDAGPQDIKTLFMQEMIANGVLIIASFNFCFAHEDHHISRVVAALDRTLAAIKDAIIRGEVHARIKGKVIEKAADVRSSRSG